MPCTCPSPASDWLVNDFTTCTECGLEIQPEKGSPIDLVQQRTSPFVYPKGRMSFSSGVPVEHLKSRSIWDYLKEPTAEEAVEIRNRWRSAYPALADWSKTLTGRRPSEPETQDFPDAFKPAVHDTYEDFVSANFSDLETRVAAWGVPDHFLSNHDVILAYCKHMVRADEEVRQFSWYAKMGDLFVQKDELKEALDKAGIAIAVTHEGALHLDFESSGGMVSGFHDRSLSDLVAKQLVKAAEYEPASEAHWETLRDRKHGRRRHRGKGRR